MDKSGDVKEWLRRAKGNLAKSKVTKTEECSMRTFALIAGCNSSSDNWLLKKYGSIEFDGHLNLYMEGMTNPDDAEAGLIIDYKNIKSYMDKLESIGGSGNVFSPDGTTITVSGLQQIMKFNNQMLILDAMNTAANGGTSSQSSKALEDGFMSQDEAKKIKENPMWRLIGVDPLMNYSTRFILNDHGSLKTMYEEHRGDLYGTDVRKKANKYYEDPDNNEAPTYEDETGLVFTLQSVENSRYHGDGAFKWVGSDGKEMVITEDGAYDMNPNHLGTFNFANEDTFEGYFDDMNLKKRTHGQYDVVPYFLVETSPDATVAFANRVAGPNIKDRIKNWYSNFTDEMEEYYYEISNSYNEQLIKNLEDNLLLFP